MRRKKYLFNMLLLKYNKYKAKLMRFRLTGRNKHRQGVLEKHLERLQEKLSNLLVQIKKRGAIVAVSTALALAPNLADAQITFAGELPGAEINPSGIANIGLPRSNSNLVDLDNDGDLDLMSGDYYGGFSYFENTGTATSPVFGNAQTNPFGLTGTYYYSSADLVDLDGDGDLDLLAGEYIANFIYFENTGTASSPAFGAAQTNPFGLAPSVNGTSSDLVDLDNDGDFDLMTGDTYNNFHYFENTGTALAPAFAAEVLNPFSLTPAAGLFRVSSNLVDVDGDGDLDLMSGEYYGNFYFYENTGTPTAAVFGAAQMNPFSLTSNANQSSSDLVDLDNDGDLDLMSGSVYGDFYYFNNISGVADVLDFSPEFPSVMNPFGLNNYSSYSSANFADLDNDGDLDLMGGSRYGDFIYYQNIGSAANPAFADSLMNPFGLESIVYFSNSDLVDVDSDGDLDLMSGTNNGFFAYFENIGTATNPNFTDSISLPFNLSNTYLLSSSNLIDIDDDGDLDMMAGDYYGDFSYFENTAGSGNTPSFTTSAINPFGLTNIGYFLSFADLKDLDRDGDLDLLSGDLYGNFHYFENTGSASAPAFAAAQTNMMGLSNTGYYFSSAELADLDGDGDYDLMSGSNYGSFFYYENITCDLYPLTASLDSSTDVTCFGDNNGLIEVSAMGLSPYMFSLDNGATNQATGSFNTLAPGTYPVSIQDANGCLVSLASPVVVAEPDSIAISSFSATLETSVGAADGEISIVAEGGTGTLDINWSPSGATGATAMGLSAGTQTITITDDNNCTSVETIVLDMPNSINSLDVEALAVYPNPTNGLITVSFESNQAQDITFNMVDLMGKTIFQERASAVSGSFSRTLDLSDFSTGVYLLEIYSDNGTVTKKITISK